MNKGHPRTDSGQAGTTPDSQGQTRDSQGQNRDNQGRVAQLVKYPLLFITFPRGFRISTNI